MCGLIFYYKVIKVDKKIGGLRGPPFLLGLIIFLFF